MSDTTTNLPELTVSELSANLKRTIETNYDVVRVRGELGRVTIARSGHMYADIKDDKAVLNSVMWKGQVDRLPFRPEEGLEVVAEGKLSIYAGRSNYQLIATDMRPAGAGALMALLEERKKKLAAEGLFDPAHKKALPFLPRVIGVVTSPTGAVIRDILHRVADRFPTRVILWPALVQGEAAKDQIEAGIRGFNAMTGASRPDVLIVGRGGGSIEDLWPFNEENVVRAAFESEIPLISAVGHETDTTLIDHVADARAPTPTGAAEIAVPVRADLLLQTSELGQRIRSGLARRVSTGGDRLRAARLPRPAVLMDPKRQRLDFAATSLPRAIAAMTERASAKLVSLRLPSAPALLGDRRVRLDSEGARLSGALMAGVKSKRIELTESAAQLRPQLLSGDIRRAFQTLTDIAARARPARNRLVERKAERLAAAGKLLETLSHQSTLARGFALVRAPDGSLLRSAAAAKQAPSLSISFADGEVIATPSGAPPAMRAQSKTTPQATKPAPKKDQGSLF